MSTVLHDISAAAVVRPLVAGTVTTNGNGTGADLGPGDGPCTLIQHVVAVAGTTPTLGGSLYESNDNTTGWTLLPLDIAEVTAAPDLQVLQFRRTKRYVRYARSLSGTTPSFTMSAVAIQQRKTIE